MPRGQELWWIAICVRLLSVKIPCNFSPEGPSLSLPLKLCLCAVVKWSCTVTKLLGLPELPVGVLRDMARARFLGSDGECMAEMWNLVLLQWINSRTAVLLDSVEKLHVIDRQTQEELETFEISEVQLVYNSSHFKSLATGGNVSEALVGTGGLFVFAAVFNIGPKWKPGGKKPSGTSQESHVLVMWAANRQLTFPFVC